MTNSILNRRNVLAIACALAITGVSAPGLAKHKNKDKGHEPVVHTPSNIGLSPGYFNGRDSSGTNIRAQVKRAGRDFRVQSLKGKNGPERLYTDTGSNVYRAANGYYITVTSTRSFQWYGPHGNLVMND